MSTRWEDREPDLRGVVDEVRRLFRRAKRRKLLVLALTLLAVALVGVREARKQRTYPARVILSATEGDEAVNGAAHTNAKLSDYLWYAVFTDRQLVVMAKKHGFRPDLQAKNERMLIDAFRDDLDVDVYKNEFREPRYPGGPPRSARIAVSMRMPDPNDALAITRDLGDLVIQRDAANRKERYDVEQKLANEVARLAEDDVARQQRDLASARAQLEIVDPRARGPIYVEIADLERQVVRAQTELKNAQEAKRKLDLQKAADKESLTLKFDRVDWGAAPTPTAVWLLMVRTLLLSFLGLFPLVAMGVGAFDRRVYDDRDVGRAGLLPLGVVRRMRTSLERGAAS
ncbi:MAG TPA: hypothetical protein VL400_16755 [Polyangiaceae bacterium]|jgi:hypothetical protein|nr:hypothetical protein [Polyangiaceae bacterium]